jgi:hypothetical protein
MFLLENRPIRAQIWQAPITLLHKHLQPNFAYLTKMLKWRMPIRVLANCTCGGCVNRNRLYILRKQNFVSIGIAIASYYCRSPGQPKAETCGFQARPPERIGYPLSLSIRGIVFYHAWSFCYVES